MDTFAGTAESSREWSGRWKSKSMGRLLRSGSLD